jgi:hypothetical protein
MDWQATALKTMRRITRVVATALGSAGILALWASFHQADFGLDAIMMLSSATFLTLAMPPEQAGARRPRRWS